MELSDKKLKKLKELKKTSKGKMKESIEEKIKALKQNKPIVK